MDTTTDAFKEAQEEARELRAYFQNRRALRRVERQRGEAEKDRLIRVGIQKTFKKTEWNVNSAARP